MKRKYFIGAMATLLLGACSQDEVMSVKQDGINYSVTTPSLTRAADSYCNEDLPTSFKVWAETTEGNLYINGDVISQQNGNWVDQNGTRYWPTEGALDFYAEVNGDAEFAFNSGAPTFNNFTVKSKVEEQVDLLYAVAKGLSKNDATVNLNFRHALSQVCFRAKNNTKTLSVVIKGVSVGHLTDGGTFTFPTTDTDENYTHPDHGDEVDPDAPDLNGGTWALNAAYETQYDVTLDAAVTLAPNSNVTNLTCPGDDHANGFKKVLTLMPQEVNAWNPQQTGTTYNGAYFLIDLVFNNMAGSTATQVYAGKVAVPVTIDWEQGYRYIYTFVFDEGGNGGWTPDPDDPEPVLANISWDVTVDDFIPAYPDGGESDGTHMDTDNDGGEQGGGGYYVHNLLVKDMFEVGIRIFGTKDSQLCNTTFERCGARGGEGGIYGDIAADLSGCDFVQASQTFLARKKPNKIIKKPPFIDIRANGGLFYLVLIICLISSMSSFINSTISNLSASEFIRFWYLVSLVLLSFIWIANSATKSIAQSPELIAVSQICSHILCLRLYRLLIKPAELL